LLQADKELAQPLADKMIQLVESVNHGLSLVGEYIVSPYQSDALRKERCKNIHDCPPRWMGDLSLKEQLIAVHMQVQTHIEQFAVAFEENLWNSHMVLPEPNPDEPKRHLSYHLDPIMAHNKFRVSRYTTTATASHRALLGRTLDYYFKTGPRRTFCSLCIQVAIQVSECLT
jgi:hypothetical protein